MSEAQSVSEVSNAASDLTAFQQNILTILSEEAMYGLAIKRELEAYYDADVNHGRLYPNLDELVEMGFVEKSELDKRTNQYELTKAGHDTVLSQLEWVLSRFATDDGRADEVRAILDDVTAPVVLVRPASGTRPGRSTRSPAHNAANASETTPQATLLSRATPLRPERRR